MLWNTYLVFAGAADMKRIVTLLWTFKLPWNWAYRGTLFHPGWRSLPSALQRDADLHGLGAGHDGAF